MGSDDGVIYALSATGSLLWSYSIAPAASIDSSPALGAGGAHDILYIGADNGYLHALDTNPAATERLL